MVKINCLTWKLISLFLFCLKQKSVLFNIISATNWWLAQILTHDYTPSFIFIRRRHELMSHMVTDV